MISRYIIKAYTWLIHIPSNPLLKNYSQTVIVCYFVLLLLILGSLLSIGYATRLLFYIFNPCVIPLARTIRYHSLYAHSTLIHCWWLFYSNSSLCSSYSDQTIRYTLIPSICSARVALTKPFAIRSFSWAIRSYPVGSSTSNISCPLTARSARPSS